MLKARQAADLTPPARAGWRWFWALFALLLVWLGWAAWQVNIDFDDGYAAIVNAQYFLGITDHYYWQRGPAFAWLLMPAEWLANAWGMHPLDVHLHHTMTALLHAGYLFGVWWILQREFGSGFPTVLAWSAATLTPVFFSYAPFVSHDIFPGLLALLMLREASRFLDRGGSGRWLTLFAVGAALALIKQTFALVWVCVLASHLLLQLILPREQRARGARLAALAAAALASGAVTFLTYSILLAPSAPDTVFWARPFKVMQVVAQLYDAEGGATQVFYRWLYLRNLSAYGIVAVLLLPPGLYLSWRSGSRFQRSTLITTVLLIVCLSAITFKEVRYLAFLAPLIALLIVPPLQMVWEQRAHLRWLVIGLILLDVGRNLPEALRLRQDFYRNAVTGFFAELPLASAPGGHVYADRPVSLISPEPGAFFADRYHRITHLGGQVGILYGYPAERWTQLANASKLDNEMVKVGDFLIFSTDVAVRAPPFLPGNRAGIHSQAIQGLAQAQLLDLKRNGEFYELADPAVDSPRMLLRAPGSSRAQLVGYRFDLARIRELTGPAEPPDRLQAMGFRFLRLCQKGECTNFTAPAPDQR